MLDGIQELEAAAASATAPAEKASALNALAEALTDADPNRAIAIAKEAGQMARGLSEPSLYINSLLNAAWALHNLADYAGSVMQALEALKLAHEYHNQDSAYDALNILGTNYNVVGNRPDALQSFMQALRLAEATGNTRKVATIQNNIGLVFEGMEDYNSALTYYQQAYEGYCACGAPATLRSIAGANVAESHNHLGQYQQAFEAAKEAASIAAAAGFAMGEGVALMQMGNACGGLGHYDEAEKLLDNAMHCFQKADSPYHRATLLKSSAHIHMQKGDTRASIETLQQTLAIFESLEAHPAIFSTHWSLAQAYASLDDYRQAFYHMEQFHEFKERVFNEQADSREKTLQAMFEVDKARLEAENQRHRSLALQQEIEQNEAIIAELDSYAENVAHDLKNPIGLIVGFADLIQSDPDNRLSETSQECLTTLQGAADKLSDIVGALLSLAKARKQEVMPQPVDMTKVLHETLERLLPLAERAGATLHAPPSLPPCLGHTSWLEEALVNLVSNALKYGGSPPVVRIDYALEPDGMITYHVTDNGLGLSAEQQQKLFKKFERLGKEKIEGTGLGLMVVKTIIDKLGGRIAVSSSGVPGEGSTFSFTLRSTSVREPAPT
jgi:signal transduction histidine kinase